jgi:2-polyprenyl-3-methyl-5-hydroxy-6-metoxy-1,4-benzoquinol methylase
MTDIKKVLDMVGFSDLGLNWAPKEIKLRDGRDAILWVNELNGHGILDPEFWITKEEYEDEYREEFSANLNNKTKPQDHLMIYEKLNQRQFYQFSKYVHFDSDVLEIGSSFGGVLRQVLKYDNIGSYTAIEPNKEDAKFIRGGVSSNKLKVVNDFFTTDSEFDKEFDLVVSFEVLEHIEKPIEFIKTIHKNLKFGGRVNIEVPNHHDALLHTFKNKGYSEFYYHKAHIHYFTPTSLNNMFSIEGFTGHVEGFQMYSAANQLSWIHTGKPQGSATSALGISDDINIKRHDFKHLMENLDYEWKEYVEAQLISDCLVYKGMKTI